MRSLTGFKANLTVHWCMSLFIMFVFLGCVRLGYWQIQRGVEKKHMLNTHHSFILRPPIAWKPHHPLPAQYQRILVKGQWMPQVILLDNQPHEHQFGYHVLSPLLLKDGKVVLVDRGWVLGDMTRKSLPIITPPLGSLQVSGSVYFPSEKSWILGQVIEKEQPNLLVVEMVDTKVNSQFLHKSVYPFIIRIGEGEANAFVRDWPVVSMSPERHYAYALQWFGLALVALVGYVSFIRHRV
ncbi:MAG: SURF1 family protein [Legionellales bacterium]|nr:SURF1 family protein [Legionellales bacterium]